MASLLAMSSACHRFGLHRANDSAFRIGALTPLGRGVECLVAPFPRAALARSAASLTRGNTPSSLRDEERESLALNT